MTDSSSIARRDSSSCERLSKLLLRLDVDTDKAWTQYHLIRLKLVKFFECNRCSHADEYADEVLDRIAKRSDINEIRDVPSFAIGVARNLCLEDYKKTQRMVHFDGSPQGDNYVTDPRDYHKYIVEKMDDEVRLQCLEHCLTELRTRDRELALDYYSAEGRNHEHRQNIAEKMGLTMDALRVSMNRIRKKLEECVDKCLESRRERLRAGSRNSSTFQP